MLLHSINGITGSKRARTDFDSVLHRLEAVKGPRLQLRPYYGLLSTWPKQVMFSGDKAFWVQTLLGVSNTLCRTDSKVEPP